MPVTMRVKLNGIEPLIEILKKIDVKFPAAGVMSGYADAVVEEARAIAPVRSGFLRSRIQKRTLWGSVWIGTDCPYAPWVEFGTSRMAPRPHMGPAVAKVTGEFEMMLSRTMTAYLAELMP